MALYDVWDVNPNLNTAAPPAGAPELMQVGKLNDCVRQVMAACKELSINLPALNGTMALQNASAVAITGGTVAATHSGDGAGLTNLNAANLASGIVPAGRLSGTYACNISGNAATASAVAGFVASAQIPIGGIIMWYGAPAAIPAGFQICDGTNGTPNMAGMFPIGVDASHALGVAHGSGFAVAGSADSHVLSVAEMPLHGHPVNESSSVQSTASSNNNGGVMLNNSNVAVQAAYSGAPSNTLGQQVGGTGGGAGHTHTLTGATIDPKRIGLWFIQRLT